MIMTVSVGSMSSGTLSEPHYSTSIVPRQQHTFFLTENYLRVPWVPARSIKSRSSRTLSRCSSEANHYNQSEVHRLTKPCSSSLGFPSAHASLPSLITSVESSRSSSCCPVDREQAYSRRHVGHLVWWKWRAEEERCAEESYTRPAATARYAAEAGEAFGEPDGQGGR